MKNKVEWAVAIVACWLMMRSEGNSACARPPFYQLQRGNNQLVKPTSQSKTAFSSTLCFQKDNHKLHMPPRADPLKLAYIYPSTLVLLRAENAKKDAAQSL